MSARTLVETLRLAPHPEGGWYREIHRSPSTVETPRGKRSAITTIYYLLEADQLSRWHVVESDEIWHFYAGAPLELVAYDSDTRQLTKHLLAQPNDSAIPVATIEAKVWQTARSTGEWSLVGCSVGPGFDFSDFRFVSSLKDHKAHFAGALAEYIDRL